MNNLEIHSALLVRFPDALNDRHSVKVNFDGERARRIIGHYSRQTRIRNSVIILDRVASGLMGMNRH